MNIFNSVIYPCRFPCEVRVRSVPLQPCRRHGKKRGKDDEGCESVTVKKEPTTQSSQGNNAQGITATTGSGSSLSSCQKSPTTYVPSVSVTQGPNSGIPLEMAMEAMEAQLQSSQV